jgi:hypothetical protein
MPIGVSPHFVRFGNYVVNVRDMQTIALSNDGGAIITMNAGGLRPIDAGELAALLELLERIAIVYDLRGATASPRRTRDVDDTRPTSTSKGNGRAKRVEFPARR